MKPFICGTLFLVQLLFQGAMAQIEQTPIVQAAPTEYTNHYTAVTPIGLIDHYAFVLEISVLGKNRGVNILRYDLEKDMAVTKLPIRKKKSSAKEFMGYNAFILNNTLYGVTLELDKKTGVYKQGLLKINHELMTARDFGNTVQEASPVFEKGHAYSRVGVSPNGKFANIYLGFFTRSEYSKENAERQCVTVLSQNGQVDWQQEFVVDTTELYMVHEAPITNGGIPYLKTAPFWTKLSQTQISVIKPEMAEHVTMPNLRGKTGNGIFEYFRDDGDKQTMANWVRTSKEPVKYELSLYERNLDRPANKLCITTIDSNICKPRRSKRSKKSLKWARYSHSFHVRYAAFNDDGSSTVVLERVTKSDSSMKSESGYSHFIRELYDHSLVLSIDQHGTITQVDSLKRPAMIEGRYRDGALFVMQGTEKLHTLYNGTERPDVVHSTLDNRHQLSRSFKTVIFPLHYVRTGNRLLFAGLLTYPGAREKYQYVSIINL